MNALVDITGTPSITPGGIVKIDKYETKFDGFWYVRSVRHELTKSELMTTLEIAKDSLDGDTITINPVAKYTEPPAAALLNGIWITEKDLQDVYS